MYGPAGLRGEVKDRFAFELGLVEGRVDRNLGLENLAVEEPFHIIRDELIHRNIASIHAREEDAQDVELGIQSIRDLAQRLQEVGHSLKCQDAHLAGNQDMIGGDQAVQRQVA